MNVTIGERGVDELTDDDLVQWFNTQTGGYNLRDTTAAVWVAIMRSLDQQGPPMTVRGLFYACENVYHVAPKTEGGYRQVAYHILQMRRRHVLPYHFIADHTRWVRKPASYSGLRAYLEHGRRAYRRALWDNQDAYVELWCEKDAVAGILSDVTTEWDVPLLVVRGYSSETFAYNAAETIKAQSKPVYLYYFGDYDPSGLNITEDIQRKLEGFGAWFTFERVAVTREQIEDWDLPTRPPKRTDKRAKGWRDQCVEIDAVPANVLRELAERCIRQHIDDDAYAETLQTEELERDTLAKLAQFGTSTNFGKVN